MPTPARICLSIVILCLLSLTAMAAETGTVIKSGDYEMLLSDKYVWTTRRISFGGVELGTPRGFYNTVIATKPGKFVGGGHKEGGVETFVSAELTVDGKAHPLKAGETVTGKKVVFRKITMLDKLKLHTEIVITPDGIEENKHFEAMEDQPLHLAFVYLYCWNENTTEWIAQTASGKELSGRFDGSGKGKNPWHLGKDVKWAAIYSAETKAGMVTYFPKVIPGVGRRSSFWEVKGAYNKYYLMADVPSVAKKGYKSPEYRLILKGIKAEPAKLKAAVEEAVVALNKTSQAENAQAAPAKDITFAADYTPRAMSSADAQFALGATKGSPVGAKKFSFDFDTMAHTNRGLQVGDGLASASYSAADSMPASSGSLEMVVKAGDWPWNDGKVHVLFQTLTLPKSSDAKLFIYKNKSSGLAAYFEPNRTGKKVFLNASTAKWEAKSWHHALFTWTPEKLSFYVDGQLAKDMDLASKIIWPAKFSVGPYGRFGKAGKSTISNVTIFNRALNADEAAALAKERLPELKGVADKPTASLIGKKVIGKPSPWFKDKPKVAMDALTDDAVLPPWTPVIWKGTQADIWGRTYDFGGKDIARSIRATDAELLSGPIVLKMNDRDLAFGPPRMVRQGKGRIIFERTAAIGATLRMTVEYDGMMWATLKLDAKNAGVKSLSLEIPIHKDSAELVHYVGAPKKYESQDLVKNSYSLALDAKEGVIFKSPFRTTVWVGDNNRGLMWFAESDQFWFPKDRDDVIQITRDAKGAATLSIAMITEALPKKLDAPMTISFGLMATPVKANPAGWRGHTFSAQYDSFKGAKRGSRLIYWPNEWRFMSLDPEPYRANRLDANRAKVARDRAEKRKIIPYWSRLHYNLKQGDKINPDAEPVRAAWATEPNRPGGGHHQLYRASNNTEWTDYLVWCVREWGRVMGHIDGVYIDETQPIPNTLAQTGGGYTAINGTRRPTFEIFGTRNMIKRMNWTVWKDYKVTPASVAHCSATHAMPTLSPYTYMLIGEQYYSGYFENRNPDLLPPNEAEYLYYYSYSLPMDRLRAECVGKQWGSVMVWLPCLKNKKALMKHPTPARDMLSRVMQADMLIWPLFIDNREVWKTWKFREDFGIADPAVTFTPYWDNTTITADKKDVVVGYYTNGKKALVLISNLNRTAQTISLSFGNIKITSLANAETGRSIPLENGKLPITIKRNDYVALRVNY
jgi:Concanavalin A-like lectin/glucanases superfamily/Glycoside hydrolase 123, N-terminal domain